VEVERGPRSSWDPRGGRRRREHGWAWEEVVLLCRRGSSRVVAKSKQWTLPSAAPPLPCWTFKVDSHAMVGLAATATRGPAWTTGNSDAVLPVLIQP